jgi:hypothetical protein
MIALRRRERPLCVDDRRTSLPRAPFRLAVSANLRCRFYFARRLTFLPCADRAARGLL